MNERRIELISGFGAGAVGLLGLIYALFGPTYRYLSVTTKSDGTTSVTSGTASLVERQPLEPVTIVVLAALALLVVGVAVGAYLHSQRGLKSGRALLGLSTALLAFGTVLSCFSIGLFLVPGLLLALIAAAMADRRRRNSTSSQPEP